MSGNKPSYRGVGAATERCGCLSREGAHPHCDRRECRRAPGTAYAIAGRLRRKEGGIKSVVSSLERAGAIRSERRADAQGRIWRFNPDPAWSAALDEAERRASTGLVRDGVRLIMVPANGMAQAWRLLANSQANEGIAWVAECPGSVFGLLFAIDERGATVFADRLIVALQDAGVSAVTVRARSILSREELSARATEVSAPFDPSEVGRFPPLMSGNL